MDNFHWIGGRLWLDAVNSEFIRDGARVDGWSDVAAFEAWWRGAGERHEEAMALVDFKSDEAVLEAAKRLRAWLRSACETAQGGDLPSNFDSQFSVALNEALGHRGVSLRLESSGQGWREREVASGEVEDALWLLARSAGRSCVSGELARLKLCAHSACILWFLDTSKNGTRRWCSMELCGNRHKVAAHLQRRKTVSAASTD